ncbi:hypothetical protein APY04_2321 [Hyphomicrobium sulfonivorans]|uniref:Uncharacterized protein n=1 Tax=Hyphomicrobium sulfonivorans TaxID=121290 RepID=A0A125NUI1_HYPSL|nr:hypothetical protein APY04_2321 [Hyphomicrobium sulfonivorans]
MSGCDQPSAPARNTLARWAFLAAGAMLAGVSVALAALSGWSRGATPLESAIWSAAGVALALVGLFGLSLAMASHGQHRRAAAAAWLLGLAFTVVAALGSQHGGRELAGRSETATVGHHARHEADHDRAAAELAALPATRPVAVIEQQLAMLLQDKRLKDCNERLASWRLRKVCEEQVAPLRNELANAEAREKALEALAEAGAALGAVIVAKPANSDASAVQRYLAAVGVHVGVERLADALNLLTVFAVEFCGAVALALGRRPVTGVTDAIAGGVHHGPPGPESTLVQSSPALIAAESTAVERGAVSRRTQIIERLKSGALEGRQVDLAKALGVPKTTLRRIVESDSRLRMVVGSQGSRLELV